MKEVPPHMPPLNLFEEIHRAESLFRDVGDKAQQDQQLQRLIGRYREALRKTHTTMERWRVVAECSACARESPGSCCFQGVEEWYDRTLLFINLLMGCRIPRSREFPGHCLFVGSRGCKLIARYSFCVNYLCPRLRRRLGPEGTAVLLAAAGDELGCGWELERALFQWLKKSGSLTGETVKGRRQET